MLRRQADTYTHLFFVQKNIMNLNNQVAFILAILKSMGAYLGFGMIGYAGLS